jgi:large subunit ribosomal protein L1
MAKKKLPNNPVEQEHIAESEAEALAHEVAPESADQSNLDEEAEEAVIVEKGADADQTMPAEVAALHVITEADLEEEKAAAESGSKKTKKTTSKTTKKSATSKKPSRSKRYLEAKHLVEAGKAYGLTEAIDLAQKTSVSKFDGAIELHLHLAKKKGKTTNETTRGMVTLPHGTGKNKKIVVLTEELIEEIAKTKKITFDVAVAAPALMPKVAKIARILGPQGKMPDPKSGTVTTNPEEVIKQINSGRIEYRADDTQNVHQIIGRASWQPEKLLENAQAFLGLFPKGRLDRAVVTATIGPAVTIDLLSLK